MKRFAVLGGGISGLSAAYYLIKLSKLLNQFNKVFLIESSKHYGGWINSIQFEDGVIHETGPKSLRIAGPQGLNTLQLAYDLGLSDQVIGVPSSAPAATKRSILVNNQLHQLPSSLKDIFYSKPPFSQSFFRYALKDIMTPKLKLFDNDDISVDDFFTQRFGKEVAMFLADPLCRGIAGGDSQKLSLKSLFPLVYNIEREYGSVILGMVRSSVRSSFQSLLNSSKEFQRNSLIDRARKERWRMWNIQGGLKNLPQSLAKHLTETEGESFQPHLGYSVNHISFKSDGSSVLHISNSESLKTLGVDHIFSAIPAKNLAKAIPRIKYSSLCSLLNSINSVSVATVYLEFKGQLIKKEDEKFGFLTPSFVNSSLLGIVYDSCCFAEHGAGKDVTRFTVMMGGEWFESLYGDASVVKEEDLIQTAIKYINHFVGIHSAPIRSFVTINKNAIPQYHVGHNERLAQIEGEIKKNKLNIDLIGSSYLGIGINDCIYNSKMSVQNHLNKS